MHHIHSGFTKRRAIPALLVFILCVCGSSILSAQTPAPARQIDGTVMDSQGLPVNGATVTVTQKQGTLHKTTQSTAGKYTVDGLPAGEFDVKVEAAGFNAGTATVDLRTASKAPVEMRLEPIGPREVISVAASRSEQRLSTVPASVNILSADEIQKTAALVADDVLRQIPTFSLFRRSSSLATHPTTQGVSLRGIGPSGGGRTLVLMDGVPFNDPFGGWVYWTRVPLMNASSIEVVDGATSSLYGNYALGGVIRINTRMPEKPTLIYQSQLGISSDRKDAQHAQFGTLYSPKMDFYTGGTFGKLGISADGSTLNSDGYPVVAKGERGAVDTKASVHTSNFNVKANYAATSAVDVYLRGGLFSEHRNNAKTSTTTTPGITEGNDTRWWNATGGVRIKLPDGSMLESNVNGDFEEFHSNNLAVPNATTRATGRQTLTQRVPVKSGGGMSQWSRAFGKHNFFTGGLDWRWIQGSTNENVFDATLGTRAILARVAGGRQRSIGGFLQDIIEVNPRLRVTVGARVDSWKNYNAGRIETDLDTTDTTLPSSAKFSNRKNTVGSPHAAAMYKVNDKVSVWAGTSWGFRAPTLNELYRQFSVGAVVTKANDQLGPERLFGWESGVNVQPVKNLSWRTTLFNDRFTHAISNITIATNSVLRENVGRTRIRGIQSDLEYKFYPGFSLVGAYIFDDARLQAFEQSTALVGKYLPQVPRHRASAGLSYSNKRIVDAAVMGHYGSSQYDDDANTPSKLLGGYFTMDVTASRRVNADIDSFFSVQNVLNREFVVQTGPRTIGAPRQYAFGLRFHL